MDAVTAISGSGTVYLLYFIECLAAVVIGISLPADMTKLLALQTVCGDAAFANTRPEAVDGPTSDGTAYQWRLVEFSGIFSAGPMVATTRGLIRLRRIT